MAHGPLLQGPRVRLIKGNVLQGLNVTISGVTCLESARLQMTRFSPFDLFFFFLCTTEPLVWTLTGSVLSQEEITFFKSSKKKKKKNRYVWLRRRRDRPPTCHVIVVMGDETFRRAFMSEPENNTLSFILGAVTHRCIDKTDNN